MSRLLADFVSAATSVVGLLRWREGVALADFPLWNEVVQMGEGMLLPRAHEDPRWLNLPEALPQVEVDARHIVQALGRLLDNAIKFNSKHGKIWMWVAQHEDEVWVQVEDTGIGIPEVEMDKVFNRFYGMVLK